VNWLLEPAMEFVEDAGRIGLFALDLTRAFKAFVRDRLRGFKLDMPELLDQLYAIGVKSLPVVLVTALFTGMVLALQASLTLEVKLKGVTQFIGRTVALPFIRELGPVLTGLIVTGRIGSAIAAEIGTMAVTEQIDALKTLGTEPVRYLGVPRLIACLAMLPMLSVLSDIVGLFGGFVVAKLVLGMPANRYFGDIPEMLVLSDLWSGLGKTVFFGGIIALISCYEGFNTTGGAEGVGKATTNAVVKASILILVSDYFLTAFFALLP
jgi:phospholipid/cholesterol/gamma-HCH transport system permease protein